MYVPEHADFPRLARKRKVEGPHTWYTLKHDQEEIDETEQNGALHQQANCPDMPSSGEECRCSVNGSLEHSVQDYLLSRNA